jgi:hypothetical protein
VWESECESLDAFEQALEEWFNDAEWKAWFARFLRLVRDGRREVFTIVECGRSGSPGTVIAQGTAQLIPAPGVGPSPDRCRSSR